MKKKQNQSTFMQKTNKQTNKSIYTYDDGVIQFKSAVCCR